MTKAQKLDIRRSEIRSKLIADNLDADERDTLTNELVDVESQWRAAVALEANESPDEPETRMDDLVSKVELRNYLDAATRGVAVTGAEAELNTELRLDVDGEVPWAAIAPLEEERTDDVTNSPTNISRTAASPLARLFAASDAAYLGVRTVQVPVGERTYPVLTGGTSADTLAKSTGSTLNTIEANAATWSTVEVSPVRATARYRWAVEDVARMGPALENALRADLSEVIRDYLDNQALNGTGTAPYVAGLITGLTRPAANPGADITVDSLLAAASGLVDGGPIARDESDVRLMINSEVYGMVSSAKTTDGSWLLPALRERVGGLRVSSRIADAPTSGANDNVVECVAYSTRPPGSVIMPVWSGVRLIRDNVSDAASGVVNLTAVWLYSLAKLRTNQYAKFLAQID